MKWLIVTDLHLAFDVIHEDVDACMILGDLYNIDPIREDASLACMAPWYDKYKVYFVPGNHDPVRAFGEVQGMVQMHNRQESIGGLTVCGVGGSVPSYKNGEMVWTGYPLEATRYPEHYCDVVLSHQGPSGSKTSLYSKAPYDEVIESGRDDLLAYIETYHPTLVIHGHTHTGRGMEMYKGTIILNPGPYRDGYYATVDTDTWSIALKRK